MKNRADLAKAVVCWNKIGLFHLPYAQGTPSPFDSPLYWSITPDSIQSLTQPPIYIRGIESLSHQLILRLPKLMAMVSKLHKHLIKRGTAIGAVKPASDLVALEVASSEREILHHAQVKSTSSAASARIVSCSFIFDSLASEPHAFIGKLKYLQEGCACAFARFLSGTI
ncbi:hypothetical protein M433DRAFT_143434 [Acidomyces richmondensis BFW]|jgi:hypothetical protein|nr:MAG: hypothetical protein FE78DRAFT_79412 [Acidomyces sp. 'richmondensis']KYG45971.1 hypothetical protein M433DRAFT_143434 [Acidomyces richmondensis BFW]